MLRSFLLLILFTSCSSWALKTQNEAIATFRDAKLHLAEIHAHHPFTLYCGCKFSGKEVDLASCGYRVHSDPARARRLEWEHVVPAEAFGQSFREWREGDSACVSRKKKKSYRGRRCARKNPQFARMEADLYNLFPEIGELNGLRSNYSMADFAPSDLRPGAITFGGCPAIIQDRKFRPADSARGVVARTYLYMDQAYPGRGIISRKNRKLFEAWNRLHPVTDWECARAKKIEAVQGNPNPVMKAACNY